MGSAVFSTFITAVWLDCVNVILIAVLMNTVIQTFEALDEISKCSHANESGKGAVLFYSALWAGYVNEV